MHMPQLARINSSNIIFFPHKFHLTCYVSVLVKLYLHYKPVWLFTFWMFPAQLTFMTLRKPESSCRNNNLCLCLHSLCFFSFLFSTRRHFHSDCLKIDSCLLFKQQQNNSSKRLRVELLLVLKRTKISKCLFTIKIMSVLHMVLFNFPIHSKCFISFDDLSFFFPLNYCVYGSACMCVCKRANVWYRMWAM